MNRKITYFFTLCIILGGPGIFAQNSLDLASAVKLAQENNIQVRQMRLGLHSSQLSLKQAKYQFLPNLNANWSYGQNWGTTFDFNVFQSVSQTTGSSNISLSSSVTLFAGFKNHHNLKARKADVASSKYSLERVKNDLGLNVALNFFNVVYGKENIRIIEKRLDLLVKQLEKTEKQFAAGLITQGDVFQFKAQIATEELNLVNARNAFGKSELVLIQSLGIVPAEKYSFVSPDVSRVEVEADLPPMEEVFKIALATMPEIKEQEAKIISSEYSMKASNANYLPTLSLTGGIYSSYSSNGVLEAGLDTVLGFEVPTQNTVQMAYLKQLDRNVRQSISLSLAVPIFNQLQTRTAVQQSKINLENARFESQNQKNILIQSIQSAYLDLQASQASYDATQKQLYSLNAAFEYAEAKFSSGIIDYYSYIKILNDKSLAEIELLNAKYNFLFKKAILDVYQGKPLSF